MGFDYTPLYYDPEKEKLDAKFGAARSGGMEGIKSRIQTGFRSKSASTRPGYRSQARQSNVRVIVILALLLVVFYFFLRSNAFIGFLEAMSGTK